MEGAVNEGGGTGRVSGCELIQGGFQGVLARLGLSKLVPTRYCTKNPLTLNYYLRKIILK